MGGSTALGDACFLHHSVFRNGVWSRRYHWTFHQWILFWRLWPAGLYTAIYFIFYHSFSDCKSGKYAGLDEGACYFTAGGIIMLFLYAGIPSAFCFYDSGRLLYLLQRRKKRWRYGRWNDLSAVFSKSGRDRYLDLQHYFIYHQYGIAHRIFCF